MKILVIYWYASFPARQTVIDHLYCFSRYSKHNFFYLNLDGIDQIPNELLDIGFDAVIFHDLFFCGRWGGRDFFESLCRKILPLQKYDAKKIAIPQDEFIHADLLNEFVTGFDVDQIYSVSPASEWNRIYAKVDRNKTEIFEVLTGYLDSKTLRRIDRLAKVTRRDLKLSYRAGGRSWRQATWLGAHGLIKIKIGEVFQKELQGRAGVDISTESKDVLMGDDWYRFLLRSEFTIGVEGGASILDWDGTIRTKTLDYVAKHPQASLKEIEGNCFPGKENSLALFALSPRHLEACATGTCQILVEGSYNGVLKANVHYIPIKRDLSDIQDAIQKMDSDELRSLLVANAYRDIVGSGDYSYQAFVDKVLKSSSIGLVPKSVHLGTMISHQIWRVRDGWKWLTLRRRFSRQRGAVEFSVAVVSKIFSLFRRIIRMKGAV